MVYFSKNTQTFPYSIQNEILEKCSAIKDLWGSSIWYPIYNIHIQNIVGIHKKFLKIFFLRKPDHIQRKFFVIYPWYFCIT